MRPIVLVGEKMRRPYGDARPKQRGKMTSKRQSTYTPLPPPTMPLVDNHDGADQLLTREQSSRLLEEACSKLLKGKGTQQRQYPRAFPPRRPSPLTSDHATWRASW